MPLRINGGSTGQRGDLVETHHKATFNLDAVDKGLGIRAELVPGQMPADLRIVDANGAPVSEVQVKLYKDAAVLRRALSDERYAGMQKVGPAGEAFAKRGIASRMEAGGVASDPLTVEAADRMAANPTAHYEALRPSLVAEAARAGVVGAGMGAGVGAGVATATRLVQKKGRLDKEDAKVIGESAAVGAASAGVGNMLGTLAQSTVVGGLAAGAVGTVYSAAKCPDRASAVQEVAVGMAGVAASVTAVAACTAAGILSAPVIGPVTALVVAWQANVQARKAAQSEALQENVRWGAGEAVQKTKQAATVAAHVGKSAVAGGARLATQAAVASAQATAQAAAAASRALGGVVPWPRRRAAAAEDARGDAGLGGASADENVGSRGSAGPGCHEAESHGAQQETGGWERSPL
ncbi:hypothetical protein HXX76_000617 [Chlamydomonas incerta]|uniref:Uncharacterized protein n=1 Tax=Chlamydomonas incerta TaxID=51695 RepID=A0A836B2R8_CHLIN|nr:hypothetical protein HXX76_000617 [Chlamydomonas incerta]|eukprot:KAG2446015.1 hypothetical protein HXX76_000617 [Chlamydomonas incerta]